MIEPLDARLNIELPSFEGPLDLLLHLIQKHELDVVDLPVAFVTERYLAYIHMMQKLDLEIAAEYLVMASTLAYIKSRTLVPPDEDEDEVDEVEEEGDPREELIRRLLEYQKYRHAAEQLGAREVLGRDVFPRGSETPQAEGPPALAGVSVFALVAALEKVLERIDDSKSFAVSEEKMSLTDRIAEVTDVVRAAGRIVFESLFRESRTRFDVVITLMAVLEMAKTGLVTVFQFDSRSAIYLESKIRQESGINGPISAELVRAGEMDCLDHGKDAEKENPDDGTFSEDLGGKLDTGSLDFRVVRDVVTESDGELE